MDVLIPTDCTQEKADSKQTVNTDNVVDEHTTKKRRSGLQEGVHIDREQVKLVLALLSLSGSGRLLIGDIYKAKPVTSKGM